MKKTLVVVDMQKDFIDGALGTKEAVAIVDNVKKKIAKYKENAVLGKFRRLRAARRAPRPIVGFR